MNKCMDLGDGLSSIYLQQTLKTTHAYSFDRGLTFHMQLSVAMNQQKLKVIKEQWIAEFSPKSVKEVSGTKHVISHNQGNKPFINCLN